MTKHRTKNLRKNNISISKGSVQHIAGIGANGWTAELRGSTHTKHAFTKSDSISVQLSGWYCSLKQLIHFTLCCVEKKKCAHSIDMFLCATGLASNGTYYWE